MSSSKPASDRRRTLVVISQVYVPDPASVGQHLADACVEMTRRGWRVVVLTSKDGYDDPSAHYSPRETIQGVEVVRLPWCSFGKSNIAIRMLAGLSFVLQSTVRSLVIGRVDQVLVSTVPPVAPLAGIAVSFLKRARVNYWLMDLNPDQMVELGKLPATSPMVRLFDWMNRRILGRAAEVIVLDRFMAKRVLKKRDVSAKLTILPPWPHEDHLEPVPHEANPFRTQHGLQDKLVVMYSGNHGHGTSLTTVLKAAPHLVNEPRLLFMFIGGGVGKKEVDETRLPNVRSLPYQPLETLRYSLSAADVHLVSMANEVVGVIHPCKVYGAMAVARPIVLLGPEESHIGDLLHRDAFGWVIRNGDVEGAAAFFRELLALPREELVARGLRARAIITRDLSKATLCKAFCDVLDREGTVAVTEPAPARSS